jgi:hypothetical protein
MRVRSVFIKGAYTISREASRHSVDTRDAAALAKRL